MSGDLVACGAIVGLGVVLHKLVYYDVTMELKAKGLGRDTLGYMTRCRNYMNKIMPNVQAKVAAYNAVKSESREYGNEANTLSTAYINSYQYTQNSTAYTVGSPYMWFLNLPYTSGAQANWTPVPGKPGYYTDGRNGMVEEASNDTGDFDSSVWNQYNSGVYDRWYCKETVDPNTTEITSAQLIADTTQKLTYPDGTPIDPKFTTGMVPKVWATFDSTPLSSDQGGLKGAFLNKIENTNLFMAWNTGNLGTYLSQNYQTQITAYEGNKQLYNDKAKSYEKNYLEKYKKFIS